MRRRQSNNKVTAGRITGSLATNFGGGIWSFSNAVIRNCIISGNSATTGGGVYGSGLSLTNCFITGNSGSGILAHYNYGKNNITNCTITGNSGSYGGGIQVYCSEVTIKDCILWANSASYGNQLCLYNWSSAAWAKATILYSDLQGGQTAIYQRVGSVLNWMSGNIDLDPLVLPSGKLIAASPCVNTAIMPISPQQVKRTLSVSRLTGSGVDMGSDEFTECRLLTPGQRR